MNRYRDCGEGVLEFTQVLHNFDDDGSGGDVWDYFNVPWGGVRTSNLNDMVFAQPNGATPVIHDKDATGAEGIPAWGDSTYYSVGASSSIKSLSSTGGHCVFAQNLICEACDDFEQPCANSFKAVVNCTSSDSVGRVSLRRKV